MAIDRILRTFAFFVAATVTVPGSEFLAMSFSLRPGSQPRSFDVVTPVDEQYRRGSISAALTSSNYRSRRCSAAIRVSASLENDVDEAESSGTGPGGIRTLYDVLGANPSMTKQEMKRLYIRLAKITHPDSGAESTVERFNEIARAWSTLSDAKLRRRYDRELAAEEFKDGVVDYARQVGEEYGPPAVKFYEEVALPLLRRSAEVAAAVQVRTTYGDKIREKKEMEKEMERGKELWKRRETTVVVPNAGNSVDNGEEEKQSGTGLGIGQAFKRVIEAGQDATRPVDGRDLEEKSIEFRKRADEARIQSLEVLEQLAEVKSERLRISFLTPSANFTSAEASQFINGFDGALDGKFGQRTWTERVTFQNSLRHDVEQFGYAEADVERLRNERAYEIKVWSEAGRKMEAAAQAELRAREAREAADRRLEAARENLLETESAVSNLGVTRQRTDQDLEKATRNLKKRMDVVREALRRRDDDRAAANGGAEYRPPESSFDTPSLDDEWRRKEQIKALRRDEVQIEAAFLRLVEQASRLVSRSERLKIRSTEFIDDELDRRPGP